MENQVQRMFQKVPHDQTVRPGGGSIDFYSQIHRKACPMRAMLLTFLIASLLTNRLFAQSVEDALKGLEWSAKVSNTKATFTFPHMKQKTWSWYNTTTSDDVLEYGWGVEIVDQKSGYQFGPVLFKPSGAATASGSLSELVEACQHTLWIVSEGGGKHAGDYDETTVEANKVRLVITKPTLLKDLFESKPPTVYMTVTTPDFAIRMKVAVDYKE
jgi:hypothetical protein